MARSTPVSRSPSASRRARRERSKSPLQEKRSKSQVRSPLQEKSSSENNISRKPADKRPEVDIFTTTPFPTKPQHILLPSTLRKQRSFQNVENQMPVFAGKGQMDGAWHGNAIRTPYSGAGRKAPVLQLKKSVTTLRDMYEAHEKSSRPSTATNSPALRPMSSSSRLRSASSSDALSGRFAWANPHRISSDDLALLPSLNEATIRKMDSESSFASRMSKPQYLTSSPNYRVIGTSSPKMPVFRDEPALSSDSVEPSSSIGAGGTIASSPNFVRLGRSSSVGGTDDTQHSSSSPNIIKLGTSSPVQRRSSSPTPSVVSRSSTKRKRDADDELPPFRARAPQFDSSPPYFAPAPSSSEPSIRSPDSAQFNSSPPESIIFRSRTAATPGFRIPARGSSESFSSSSHVSLQAALSSSPMPPIQYPVIRAPASTGQTLSIPKRNTRSLQAEVSPFTARLSPVPSEWEERLSSSGSSRESETGHAEILVAPNETGNESQIRIITDDHSHEASDELSALPRPAYRSPPLVPARTNSLYGTLGNSSTSTSLSRINSLRHSIDSRLNSLRSYSHSRQNSIISNNMRPTSSGSANVNTMVPTWARRYYSGFYRDSFQYLYNPSQNGSVAQISDIPFTLQTKRSQSLIELSREPSQVASKRNRHSLQSFRDSFRNSLAERIPSLIRARPKARESHMTLGLGPLVSNPTRPEEAVLAPDPRPSIPTIRRISRDKDLPPMDPRAHWAGSYYATEVVNGQHTDQNMGQTSRHSDEIQPIPRQSADSASVYYSASGGSGTMTGRMRYLSSPHLHRDQRLNTGSSTSRGYGHPFNGKPKYHPARASDNEPNGYGHPSWFSLDLHSTQVFIFILGFVLPISWLVGSVLPLPPRPDTYRDLEKAEWDIATLNGTRSVSEWEEIDVVARLRMERHLRGMDEIRWQNSRWWRRMNRFMSAVGIVIIVIVVVLSVIGTRGGL